MSAIPLWSGPGCGGPWVPPGLGAAVPSEVLAWAGWLVAAVLLALLLVRRRREHAAAGGRPARVEPAGGGAAVLEADDVRLMLERAECILWEAEVEIRGHDWAWDFRLRESAMLRRLFPQGAASASRGFRASFDIPEGDEIDRRARAAITTGEPGYEQEFRLVRDGRTVWVRESVSIRSKSANRHSLVGVAIDITQRKEAELAAQQGRKQLDQLLAHASCTLWQARVTRGADGDLGWEWFIPPSELFRRVTGREPGPGDGMPWGPQNVPQFAELEQRCRRALREGQAGYEQEFRVLAGGTELWLHEQVQVQPLGDGAWNLEGIVVDVTARRRAEEARAATEAQLQQIIGLSDCIVWQATVELRPDGHQAWSIYSPRSVLFRRAMGEDYAGHELDWDHLQVPERMDMERRAREAIEAGRPGYTQEFHVVRPDDVMWLREVVTINPLEAGRKRLVGVITDITAQRAAEEALRVSEERLRELLFRADCLLWESIVELTPGDWRWHDHIQPSLLCERLFGVRNPPPARGLWRDFTIPELPEMNVRCRQAIERGEPGYEQVFRIIREDGGVLWIRESVSIRRLEPGRYSLVGVATDITAQRLSEQAHAASDARLRELLARADCLLWEGTAELGPADWSWQFSIPPSVLCRRLFGRDQPATGAGLWRSFDIPERGEMDRRCRQAMEEGRPGYEQIFHIRRPGRPDIWISESVTIRPIGERRYSLVGVAVDITPQRGAEAALAEEKERLAVTLRAMGEGVITTDAQSQVRFMNPVAAKLTGWEEREAVGRPVAEICRFESGGSGGPVAPPMPRVVGEDIVVDLAPQTRLVPRDGESRLIEGCCAPIHAADSSVVGAVLVFRDVTAQDRLEQELIRATRLESVGFLAGGIAHDFNNILTGIMGQLSLAAMDADPAGPVAASLQAAEKAALRARDLTQQLLTFSKGGEPVRAAFRIEPTLREMTEFALHGSGVRAVFDLPPDLWRVNADKGQIGRVVQNLAINAVQAMPGGGTLRVAAENRTVGEPGFPGLRAGDYLLVAVTDTGHGIEPADVPRIFDPYFTTKKSGSGLGLAAVYSIIKKHQGHIEVESRPGRGATFRIWIPALNRGDSNPPIPETVSPLRMSGRVLIMDDEAIIQDIASRLFRRFGFEVACAGDGAEAVRLYREAREQGRPFQLVVTDLTVPGGMGGLETMAQLKRIEPAVKVIVSSGYSSDPVLANYRAHGFCGVVAKPYQLDDLIKVVRDALAEG